MYTDLQHLDLYTDNFIIYNAHKKTKKKKWWLFLFKVHNAVESALNIKHI